MSRRVGPVVSEGHGSDGGVIEDGATFLRERMEKMVHDDVEDDRRERIALLYSSRDSKWPRFLSAT